MTQDENPKDLRRQKYSKKTIKKDVPEEQKFASKSKKQLKKRLEQIKEEELWEDWKDKY
jgi:hypothetical protein